MIYKTICIVIKCLKVLTEVMFKSQPPGHNQMVVSQSHL